MDTQFLIAMLKLKQAIDNNDKKAINDIIAELNTLNLNDDDTIAYMKDYFINLKGDIKLIKYVIDNLNNLKDKEALSIYIELSNSFTDISISRIKTILNKDIQFEDKKSTISLYGLIAQAVIFLDNPEILQMTINKLQSLEK